MKFMPPGLFIYVGLNLLIIGLFIEMNRKPQPQPPLYFKDGAWYTDGSQEMCERAVTAAKLGEEIIITTPSSTWGDTP